MHIQFTVSSIIGYREFQFLSIFTFYIQFNQIFYENCYDNKFIFCLQSLFHTVCTGDSIIVSKPMLCQFLINFYFLFVSNRFKRQSQLNNYLFVFFLLFLILTVFNTKGWIVSWIMFQSINNDTEVLFKENLKCTER